MRSPCGSSDGSDRPCAEFIERVELELGERAREAGVLVVSALGFDSVPGDIGAQEAAGLFAAPARCTSVESFVSLRSDAKAGLGGNFATYESAVQGFANADRLAALRRQVSLAAVGPERLADATAGQAHARCGVPRRSPRPAASPGWTSPAQGPGTLAGPRTTRGSSAGPSHSQVRRGEAESTTCLSVACDVRGHFMHASGHNPVPITKRQVPMPR